MYLYVIFNVIYTLLIVKFCADYLLWLGIELYIYCSIILLTIKLDDVLYLRNDSGCLDMAFRNCLDTIFEDPP